MAISWGHWDRGNFGNGLRVGISVDWERVSHGEGVATCTVRFYVGDYYHYNDLQTIHFGGALSGSEDYDNDWGKNGGPIGDYRKVATKKYNYNYKSDEYGKSPGSVTFRANVTGSYDGATPNQSVTTRIPTRPIVRPDAPTNVTLVRNSHGGTTVKWTSHRSPGAPYDSIEIQRREYTGSGPWSDWEHAAWARSSSTSMWVKGQSTNAIYDYRVRARNEAGYSGFNSDSKGIATTPAAPSDVTVRRTQGGSALQVSWVHNAYSPTPPNTVQIQRSAGTGSGSGWTTVATLTNATTTTSWTDTSPLSGDNQYRVREQVQYGVGPGLWSDFGVSDTISALVPPLAPVNLSPDGIAIDAHEDQTFSWMHRDGGDGQSQTRAELTITPAPDQNPPGARNLAQNASFYSLSEQFETSRTMRAGSDATLTVDDHWSDRGGTSLKIQGGDAGASSAYVIGGYASQPATPLDETWAGKTLTVAATFHMEGTQSDVNETDPDTVPRSIMIATETGSDTPVWNYAVSPQAPNEPGTHRLSVTFTLPSEGSADAWFIRLMNCSQTTPVWWDSLVITEGSTDGSWIQPWTITVDGEINEVVLPADTVPNGYDYTWRVRTMGDPSQGYGPWSSIATFEARSTPIVTLTQPGPTTNTGYITAAWDYAQAEGFPQTYWRVTLLSDQHEILSEIYGYDDSSSAQIPYHIEDDQTYIVRVFVRGGGLQASDETTTTADFPLPSHVTLSTDWFPCSGAMTLELSADDPLPAQTLTNYVANPRMEATDGTVVVDANYFPDPFFERGTGGWSDGSVGTRRQVASPDGDGYALALTRTVDGGVMSQVSYPEGDAPSVPVGTTITYTCDVWIPSTNTDGLASIRISGTMPNSKSSQTSDPNLRDQWQQLKVVTTTAQETGSSGPNLYGPGTVGDVFYFKNGSYTYGDALPETNFSGDSNADGTFTYSWSGTAGMGPSLRTAVSPAGWSKAGGAGGGVLYRNSDGNAMLRCGGSYTYASTGIGGGDQTALVDTITASADCSIYLYNASNIEGRELIALQAGVPTSLRKNIHGSPNSTLYLGWATAQAVPGATLTFNRVLVTDGVGYTGPYFDGDTPDGQWDGIPGWDFEWTGEPDGSTSTATRQAQDQAVAVSIERRVTSDPDADWVTLASEVDLPTTLLDVTAPLRGEVSYRVTPNSAIPAYHRQPLEVVVLPQGDQMPAEESTWNPRLFTPDPYEWVMLSWGADFTEILRVHGDVAINDSSSGTRSGQGLLGRYRPGLLMGRNTSWGVSVSGIVRYADFECPADDDPCRFDSLPEEWRRASEYADVVCYRDYTGRRIFGFIDGEIGVKEGPRPGMAEVSFGVTELGYVESYEPLTGEVVTP